jgi:hypothetical protein
MMMGPGFLGMLLFWGVTTNPKNGVAAGRVRKPTAGSPGLL